MSTGFTSCDAAISHEWVPQVFKIGCEPQHTAAALELALRQPGQPLFEVRAPGFRQQQILRSQK